MRHNQSESLQRQSNVEPTEGMNRKEFLAEAGRSLLGLLSLPAVATITGCGPKEAPTPARLTDVLARPWTYDGKLIMVEGVVKPGNRLEHETVTMTPGPGGMSIPVPKYCMQQTYKMYVAPDEKDRSLPVLHSESSYRPFSGEAGHVHQGKVSVTGRFENDPYKHGWVLLVDEIKRLDPIHEATP